MTKEVEKNVIIVERKIKFKLFNLNKFNKFNLNNFLQNFYFQRLKKSLKRILYINV